jgi:lipid-binding SYLF domain-containing protein
MHASKPPTYGSGDHRSVAHRSGGAAGKRSDIATDSPMHVPLRRYRASRRSLLRALLIFAILSCWLAAPDISMGLTVTDLEQRILDSDMVLKNVLTMPDVGIPKDLLQRCRGLAIFPGVLRFGVVVGVSFGSGIVLRKDEKTGQWSVPAFFRIRVASLGLQAGAQSTDLILLIMSEEGIRGLLEEKFTLGADISVTAGPVGREASAETEMTFSSGILSYSRSKGVFAGFSVQGASLEPDSEANALFHGKGITVQDVFYEGKGTLSDNCRKLTETLTSTIR